MQHPICYVDVLGNQNAHNLVSISTDGRLCSWNLDMLSQPQVLYNIAKGIICYNYD